MWAINHEISMFRFSQEFWEILSLWSTTLHKELICQNSDVYGRIVQLITKEYIRILVWKAFLFINNIRNENEKRYPQQLCFTKSIQFWRPVERIIIFFTKENRTHNRFQKTLFKNLLTQLNIYLFNKCVTQIITSSS